MSTVDQELEPEWAGSWPLTPEAVCPEKFAPLVYALYDRRGRCAYVGSTKEFLKRMKRHAKDGKEWATWRAWRSETRLTAFDDETIKIRELRPYLNWATSPNGPRGADFVRWATR